MGPQGLQEPLLTGGELRIRVFSVERNPIKQAAEPRRADNEGVLYRKAFGMIAHSAFIGRPEERGRMPIECTPEVRRNFRNDGVLVVVLLPVFDHLHRLLMEMQRVDLNTIVVVPAGAP